MEIPIQASTRATIRMTIVCVLIPRMIITLLIVTMIGMIITMIILIYFHCFRWLLSLHNTPCDYWPQSWFICSGLESWEHILNCSHHSSPPSEQPPRSKSLSELTNPQFVGVRVHTFLWRPPDSWYRFIASAWAERPIAFHINSLGPVEWWNSEAMIYLMQLIHNISSERGIRHHMIHPEGSCAQPGKTGTLPIPCFHRYWIPTERLKDRHYMTYTQRRGLNSSRKLPYHLPDMHTGEVHATNHKGLPGSSFTFVKTTIEQPAWFRSQKILYHKPPTRARSLGRCLGTTHSGPRGYAWLQWSVWPGISLLVTAPAD